MYVKNIIYTLFLSALITGCEDSAMEITDPDDGVILKIGYTTDGYCDGLTRSESEEALCWSDWNEKKIECLDFYLIDKDGKISFYKDLQNESNDCNVIHTLLEFKEGGQSNIADLTFDILNSSSRIAMVANYPLSSAEERKGKSFEDLYGNVIQFSEDQHKKLQEKFVMVGFFDLPTKVSKFSNIVIPLKRIIAKIRLRIMKTDKTYLESSDFRSILCRYVNTVRIFPDELMPAYDEGENVSPSNIYPAATAVPEGLFAGSDWDYPEDITDMHPSDMVRDKGHVYYTCPADWVDYAKVRHYCSRKGNNGHKDAEHDDGTRFEIYDCDDAAPILSEREMFLLVKAPYGEDTDGNPKQYFYRIPINYRISSINDKQCFGIKDLTDKVFNLYRAQRNHFYDITVLLDRAGATSPHQAIAPMNVLGVADLVEEGVFDYIY